MYDKNTWRIFSSLHARSRYAVTIDTANRWKGSLSSSHFQERKKEIGRERSFFRGEKKKKEKGKLYSKSYRIYSVRAD